MTTKRNSSSKMRLLPLIAATYFMVSGGPYGLEDIIGKAGYGRALLLLLVVPLVWSLPTSLMVGELASALPEEGGYYCWVRRALGAFWGFQEAWLSAGGERLRYGDLSGDLCAVPADGWSRRGRRGIGGRCGRWRWWWCVRRGICAGRGRWARGRWGCSACCCRRLWC